MTYAKKASLISNHRFVCCTLNILYGLDFWAIIIWSIAPHSEIRVLSYIYTHTYIFKIYYINQYEKDKWHREQMRQVKDVIYQRGNLKGL